MCDLLCVASRQWLVDSCSGAPPHHPSLSLTHTHTWDSTLFTGLLLAENEVSVVLCVCLQRDGWLRVIVQIRLVPAANELVSRRRLLESDWLEL